MTAPLLICALKPIGVQHGAAVRDADVVDDVELAGLAVELDLDEADRERRHRARRGEVVLRDADEARARDAAPPTPSSSAFKSSGTSWPSNLPPSSIARCAACAYVRPCRRIALREHALAADVVVLRRAAQIHRRDLLELRDRVHRGDVVRARHRERRVAAELRRGHHGKSLLLSPRTTMQLSQLALSTSAATRDVAVYEYVPRLPTPEWMWSLPSGVMRTRPSKPLRPAA